MHGIHAILEHVQNPFSHLSTLATSIPHRRRHVVLASRYANLWKFIKNQQLPAFMTILRCVETVLPKDFLKSSVS
ncbi:hypothetical protein AB1N83_003263 [Pleurotus pulmonarius]